jgi:hypothetical protein
LASTGGTFRFWNRAMGPRRTSLLDAEPSPSVSLQKQSLPERSGLTSALPTRPSLATTLGSGFTAPRLPRESAPTGRPTLPGSSSKPMVALGRRSTFDNIFCTRHFAPSKLQAIPISGHTTAVSATLWRPNFGLYTAIAEGPARMSPAVASLAAITFERPRWPRFTSTHAGAASGAANPSTCSIANGLSESSFDLLCTPCDHGLVEGGRVIGCATMRWGGHRNHEDRAEPSPNSC